MCLYIACRADGNAPYLLIDFSDAIQTNMYTLGQVYMHIVQKLFLSQFIPLIDPCLFAPETKKMGGYEREPFKCFNPPESSGERCVSICPLCPNLPWKQRRRERTMNETWRNKVPLMTLPNQEESSSPNSSLDVPKPGPKSYCLTQSSCMSLLIQCYTRTSGEARYLSVSASPQDLRQ